MTAGALVLLINAFSSFLKRFVYPKFGVFGVHVIVFILSIFGAVYYTYAQHIVAVQTIVATTIGLFTVAVSVYEVLLQHLPLFKVKSIDRE